MKKQVNKLTLIDSKTSIHRQSYQSYLSDNVVNLI